MAANAGNAGAILVLGRDLVMVPKLIHPLPPQTPRSPKMQNGSDDLEEEPPTPHPVNDTWMQVGPVFNPPHTWLLLAHSQ